MFNSVEEEKKKKKKKKKREGEGDRKKANKTINHNKQRGHRFTWGRERERDLGSALFKEKVDRIIGGRASMPPVGVLLNFILQQYY